MEGAVGINHHWAQAQSSAVQSVPARYPHSVKVHLQGADPALASVLEAEHSY